MITDTPRPRRLRFTAWPKIALGIAAFLVLVSVPAKAAEPEEDYLPIFNLIQQGDALDKQGRPDQALTKYDQAIKHIREFQIRYPAFNVKMLAYRSNDVAQKIASISSKGNEAEGGQQPSSGSSSNAAAPGGQRTTGGGAVSGVSLKLLQPGAEPRKALRLHPKQGDKQTMTIEVKLSTVTKLPTGELPMKLPAIHFNLEATVQSVTPDGDIQYQTVMNDATVAEEAEAGAVPLDQIKNAFASFKGLTGSGVISSRGLTKSAELKIPPGTEPQVASMMEQMRDTISHLVLPLPEEPVGVGARWELKMPTKSQGMNVTETASIEVVSIEDDKIVTKGQIGQTAANQKIDSPMMPGIPINVTKMNETGTREATLDLSRLLPVSATVNGHSESSMNMEMAGQKQEMEIKTEMSIKAEAK